ncbi:MAG TPA: roadblock/LC7 domain-containing protein [Planctomycetota bacterium]|jgi:predicted regulator of Ras-like GTPase activity (Roadblock/LC7/MglB family)|nr:roadblock/LC7 domain-containing protein [Planctomycetota bacterium]
MNQNEKLRADRMVFYESDGRQIQTVLKELIKLSGAKCALLVDKEGHLVAKMGSVKTFDTDTISALVAGSFAATREMARLLGEEEFAVMFHQGERDNIQLNLVGDRTILTVIFDERTTVGMVRLYASEASRKLVEIFDRRAVEGDREEVKLGEDYGRSARERLDSLFS